MLGFRCTAVQIVAFAVALAAGLISCRPPARQFDTAAAVSPRIFDTQALDRFIASYMEEKHIPGLAVAIVFADGWVWTQGYGLADVASGRAMTRDTVMNVASITKTITNAAVLQLRDQGRLSLDDPIGRHLPFDVAHPRHPDVAITVRQLLTHTGGVADSDAYDESYACGDPQVELGDWLREYFTPGGRYYDREQNFLEHAPGERYSYSNLGYGLLGHLVDVVSGESFATRTRAALFEPLGMNSSGWRLDVVPRERQTVLYEWLEPGELLDVPLFGERSGETANESELVPYCPYSFYNLSDGLLRTSVRDLSRFLLAHMNGGELDGRRVLRAETVDEMFSRQLAPERLDAWEGVQGFTWRQRELAGQALWEHSGADPGVRTRMAFSPDDGVGVLVFANRRVSVRPVFERLFEEARSIPVASRELPGT